MNAIFGFTYLVKIKGIDSEELVINTEHNGVYIVITIKQDGYIECQTKRDYEILLGNINEYMEGFEAIKLVIVDDVIQTINLDTSKISFKH